MKNTETGGTAVFTILMRHLRNKSYFSAQRTPKWYNYRSTTRTMNKKRGRNKNT